MNFKSVGGGLATFFLVAGGIAVWAWLDTETSPKEFSIRMTQDVRRAVLSGAVPRECIDKLAILALERSLNENRKTYIEVSMQGGQLMYELFEIGSAPTALDCN